MPAGIKLMAIFDPLENHISYGKQMSKTRVLIFIIAFNDEAQIRKVLEKIPGSMFTDYSCEILLIVDSSEDHTFEIAHQYQLTHGLEYLKVLYNPVGQGYGGNQKLGYEYAVQNNFDVIVLLHGGDQYPPEEMGKLVSPVARGEADMVIGSRFMSSRKTQSGGMPLYKRLGNKFLTRMQNRMLKTRFTDLHSGYRAFSVKAISEVPFSLNTHHYLFDTQLFIQMLIARKSIIEVEISPFYERGIRNLNNIWFGWLVLRETIISKLQNMALFYRREYDLIPFSEEYSLKLGYLSSHSLAIDNVPPGSRVLDIGGGQGRIARELKKKGCFVAGIDKNPLMLTENYDLFYQRNLDTLKFDFNVQDFDHVLLLDIIEHLSFPEHFLDELRQQFGLNRPRIIITVPNIGFIINRLQLLLGNFNYGKEGILDKTHKRLYTFSTIKKNCRQSGYIIEKVSGIPAPFPKAIGRNFSGYLLIGVNRALIYLLRGLFSYQIYLEVRPTPVVNVLLDHSIGESLKRRKLMQDKKPQVQSQSTNVE
jgi:SAM-dependent methyltransferase